ncbi:MAG TPA: ABC transporter ATP-binding protein [Terriglobia bacterium]|nr:ABC transporter ATP-binding protein [Terriglobia bacterium]
MKLLLSYLKRYKSLVFLTLVLATINQVFSMLDPLIMGILIQDYAVDAAKIPADQYYRGVFGWLAAVVGVAFVSRVAKNFQDYFTNVITQRVGAQIYADGIQHSLDLPYSVFEDQRSGETLGKLQKVRTDVERLINLFVNVLFTSVVGIIFVVIYAYAVHWIIAPIYFATIPILGLLSFALSRKIKKVQKEIVKETTALAGSTTESLRNIELVKGLGLAKQEIERLNSATVKILGLELNKVKFVRSLSFIQGTFVNALRTGILGLMFYLMYTGRINVGQFMALWFYSFFIFGPLQELGNMINVYRETEVSLKNFEDILKMDKEPRPAHPVAAGPLDRIEFDDVTFRHQTGTTNALDGISFHVDVGETVAFVGPSGSGKTTLVKLLVALYRPQGGDIRYDGVSYDEIEVDHLRERIGLVSQDTQLFSGSIRENLLFVNPAATDAECMEVLEKAACQSLMARADKGLDTVIGEGGVKVSGGEKQRLSIARALLRRPRLLVFDEATSSLDSLTEEEITITIRDVSMRKDLITILIAHRLSTVLHADRIYVLERGRIVESGRHEDLLELKGLYYAMWRQQIGERSFRPPQLSSGARVTV